MDNKKPPMVDSMQWGVPRKNNGVTGKKMLRCHQCNTKQAVDVKTCDYFECWNCRSITGVPTEGK